MHRLLSVAGPYLMKGEGRERESVKSERERETETRTATSLALPPRAKTSQCRCPVTRSPNRRPRHTVRGEDARRPGAQPKVRRQYVLNAGPTVNCNCHRPARRHQPCLPTPAWASGHTCICPINLPLTSTKLNRHKSRLSLLEQGQACRTSFEVGLVPGTTA